MYSLGIERVARAIGESCLGSPTSTTRRAANSARAAVDARPIRPASSMTTVVNGALPSSSIWTTGSRTSSRSALCAVVATTRSLESNAAV